LYKTPRVLLLEITLCHRNNTDRPRYYEFLATMGLSRTVSETYGDFGGKNRQFLLPPVFNALVGVLLSEFCNAIWAPKTKIIVQPGDEKV